MKKLLTIESFQGKSFGFHINRNVSAFTIQHLTEGKKRFDFNVHLKSVGKDLQRPLVWTNFQKQELILSFFKGIEIGKLTLIQCNVDEQEYFYQVIDGKQRLNALWDFVDNKFPMNWCGTDYWFYDLSKDLQTKILWYRPKCDIGYEYWNQRISDADKIRWFELINFSGTPQDAEHIQQLKTAWTK